MKLENLKKLMGPLGMCDRLLDFVQVTLILLKKENFFSFFCFFAFSCFF